MCEQCSNAHIDSNAVEQSVQREPMLFDMAGHEAEDTADVALCPVCEGEMSDCNCWTCAVCNGKCGEDDSRCEACHYCENCCACWSCRDCDRQFLANKTQCSNCQRCENCCDCWYCNGCNETLGQDTYACSNCYLCSGGCCECRTCESCDQNVSNDDWCRRCDACQSCCDDECNRSEAVHGYSYKPRPWFYHEADENSDRVRFYGIELEVNGSIDRAAPTQDRLADHAYLKEDGSLDSGFEIVTHPHSFRSMRKLWSQFFEKPVLGLSSFKSGECGLHIHISRKRLTQAQIRRMVVFLNAPENTPLIERIAQRGSNHYSQISPKKLATALRGYGRYEALNLENEHTVELRIFRGSYRLDRVLKALDFADALVEFTRDCSYRELTENKFMDYLKLNRKRYKWLWSFLTGEALPPNTKPGFAPKPMNTDRTED